MRFLCACHLRLSRALLYRQVTRLGWAAQPTWGGQNEGEVQTWRAHHFCTGLANKLEIGGNRWGDPAGAQRAVKGCRVLVSGGKPTEAGLGEAKTALSTFLTSLTLCTCRASADCCLGLAPKGANAFARAW